LDTCIDQSLTSAAVRLRGANADFDPG